MAKAYYVKFTAETFHELGCNELLSERIKKIFPGDQQRKPGNRQLPRRVVRSVQNSNAQNGRAVGPVGGDRPRDSGRGQQRRPGADVRGEGRSGGAGVPKRCRGGQIYRPRGREHDREFNREVGQEKVVSCQWGIVRELWEDRNNARNHELHTTLMRCCDVQ